MMYEIRRKLEPTLLPTQGICNAPYHIDRACKELAFDYIHYTQQRELNCSTDKYYGSDGIHNPVRRVTNAVP